ncbi:putative NAD(P)/FAD-binding protein YdhS [Novosphingobium fluoreni]|uniref:Putative NAD(P)/FAD-binding protein YdhS n=1 Tax=Novosphingobium fluoreni TaxID=1391222 RepID=A0A7W6C8C7_9SPHN|nr:hypothetical protein [Novosphingobium fluoreni]MBB3940272.1 putative NAD(P)/FAD-binding protein YdhS [Novosphingobium fluoreni]
MLASGRIEHVRAQIASVEDEGNGWKLETDAAQSLSADILVIATSHPPPAPPVILAEAFDGQPKFVADPWAIDALAPIGQDDRVLIVGTGLTMADVVATLDASGHMGPITAICRRGQRSKSHAAVRVDPFGDFATSASPTALDLPRRIRLTVEAGGQWQGLFDRLRTQGPDIWRALPLVE